MVSEQIMNAGTDFADLVLPVTTYYEEPFEVVTAWSSMYVQVREQAISPMYEAKTDWEIGQMLAERFGVKKGSLWELDIKDYYRDYVFAKNLAPEFSSMDFDELCDKKVLRANFPEPFIAFESQRFQTPSGKVELYTEGLVDFGEELACFYEPYESNRNEKAADYPLDVHELPHGLHHAFAAREPALDQGSRCPRTVARNGTGRRRGARDRERGYGARLQRSR